MRMQWLGILGLSVSTLLATACGPVICQSGLCEGDSHGGSGSGTTSSSGGESDTSGGGTGGDGCDNGIKDGDETDIDCGGSCGERCGGGQGCADGDDCESGTCEGGVCEQPPGCSNGIKDGDESDIDCGGSCGATCGDGQGCENPGDCVSGVCLDGTCGEETPPSCDNGVYDPGETDVDCGGVCGASCEDGEQCAEDEDCVSNYCDHETKSCTTPSCADGMQNGDESDTDCGGSCGDTCQAGQRCDDDGDCVSHLCDPNELVCVTPDACENGVLDEGEAGIDCGGVCGPTCMNGEHCDEDGDCKSGYCAAGSLTCENPTCEDGVENGNETDIDCGGACDADCDEGEGCEDDADCVTGACGPDDVCVAAECKAEPEDNMCQSCIKAECCDAVVECLKEAKCTCWLECVAHNNDFEPCKLACGIKGNPGQITACANNNCNSLNACALPEV